MTLQISLFPIDKIDNAKNPLSNVPCDSLFSPMSFPQDSQLGPGFTQLCIPLEVKPLPSYQVLTTSQSVNDPSNQSLKENVPQHSTEGTKLNGIVHLDHGHGGHGVRDGVWHTLLVDAVESLAPRGQGQLGAPVFPAETQHAQGAVALQQSNVT